MSALIMRHTVRINSRSFSHVGYLLRRSYVLYGVTHVDNMNLLLELVKP